MYRVLLLLSLAFSLSQANAYPELVRRGYTNCVSCHLSPSGGGVLTEYGRGVSQELLAWNFKTSDATDENAPVKKWHFGGEARGLMFYLNNEYETNKRLIPMQAQGDVAYDSEKLAFAARVGLTGQGESIGFQAPTAYGLWRPAEYWYLRAGRFLPGYGLNNSIHFLGTRGELGFGFDDSREGVEASWLGVSWGFNIAAFGPRGENGQSAEMAQIQYSPTDKSKFALNFWNENKFRKIYGLWFVLPLGQKIFWTADWNIQREEKPKTDGYALFNKLGVELHPGLNLIAMSDNSQRDKKRDYTRIDRYGPGVQVFPFPRLDFELAWLSETNRLYSNKRGDYAYLMVHGYY